MRNDLVSIITPLHQSGEFIEETISSVISQTYTNWEMIVVDDGSTDSGPEKVKNFMIKDHRVKLLKNQRNSGPAVTRNNGIEIAKGRFIAFLDSDDIWEPNKLEIQLKFMTDNNYAFTYTAYDKISENGSPFGRIDVPRQVSYTDLLKTCSIGCLTVIYDTQQIQKVYMPIINKRQDFALWLKILKKIPFAYGLNLPLAKYRLRNNSISGNKWKASQFQWKVYREIEKINFFKSAYYFSFYTFNGFIKTYLK
jgi:teichuronic acid biosynthesis glycosyltransferase TuaG